jgi:hypothetical protein
MSQLTTIAIAKMPLGEIHIESYGSTMFAVMTFYRKASSEPLTLAEIGQIIETALDDFSFNDVENAEGLSQGDFKHPHFLEMVMMLQAKLFQQKYQTLA